MKCLKNLLIILLFSSLLCTFSFSIYAYEPGKSSPNLESDNDIAASLGNFSSEEDYIKFIKSLQPTDFYILEATRVETYTEENSTETNVISKLKVKNVLSCEVSGTDMIKKNDYIYVHDKTHLQGGIYAQLSPHQESEMVMNKTLIFYVYKFPPEHILSFAHEPYIWEYALISPDSKLRTRCFTEEFSPIAYQNHVKVLTNKVILGVAFVCLVCLVIIAVTRQIRFYRKNK